MAKKKKKDKVVEVFPDGKYKKLRKGNVIALICMVVLAAFLFYISIPALSIYSDTFWFILIVALALILLATLSWSIGEVRHTRISKLTMYVMMIAVVFLILGAITSLKIFSSSKYAGLLKVEDGDFETDIKETESISDIAIMDTQTAITIGNRAIGSLTDIVSQFVVSVDYSQIDYNGKPMKVAPLEYAGLIKYFNNRKEGIPGYVIVDPVSNEANYVKLDKPMKYTPSAFFNENLERHLRFQYPTYLFNSYSFELDPDGNPYYVCAVLKANAGIFGAKDVKGVVICDPCTGESKYYDVADVPNWVDRVYDGDLLTQKYDWYGRLSGGYWNSIFGNKGCKMTTDDYGYKVIDGDVWVYTGVTSVNADESNIGFVLMNERTAEAKYYKISGAEEYSAMSSAQGEVQHLGYIASFPSLINIGGEPTYIMAMKDEAGLVKMYALVNVEKYNIVATGASQHEALSAYKKLMKENGISQGADSEAGELSKQINIETIRYVDVSGETIVYIIDKQGNVYKQAFAENEALIFLKEGDRITVHYEESEDGIHSLISYE
ncbi:MAG: hypothetical protein ACI4GW_06780 [Lachnospiraceae bacterium]